MGLGIFMPVLLVVVLVIALVYRALGIKQNIARTIAEVQRESNNEPVFEAIDPNEALVELRMNTVHAKTLGEIYQDGESQIAIHERSLVAMSFDRNETYCSKELKGRVVDYAVILSHDTYSELACTVILICQPSLHEYLYEKFNVMKTPGFKGLKLERQFSLPTEMARIAHVFCDDKGLLDTVALIGKEGLDMEFVSFNGASSQSFGFDTRVIADGCVSDDDTFYTFDGSIVTRWLYGNDGMLDVQYELESQGNIDKAFFKHTRETAGMPAKPLLYDGSNIVFLDTSSKVALDGVQTNTGNVFFTTSDALWLVKQDSQPLKIMDRPMIPVLFLNHFQDKSSFTGIFKTEQENQAFAFDMTEGSLSKAGICRTSTRILDATYDNNDGTLYIFTVSETYVVRNFLDLGFEVVLSANPPSEIPETQIGM